jgi:hypothetical protein
LRLGGLYGLRRGRIGQEQRDLASGILEGLFVDSHLGLQDARLDESPDRFWEIVLAHKTVHLELVVKGVSFREKASCLLEAIL